MNMTAAAMVLRLKIYPNFISKIRNYKFFSSTSGTGNNNLSKFCEKLINRSVLEVRGEETAAFLQGLITNDIHHLTNGNKSSVHLPCIFSMMLNTQGRVLYDIFLYKDKENPLNKFFVECDSRISENIAKHLKIYRVRKKIDITVNHNLDIWSLFDDITMSKDFSTVFDKYQDILITKDPRVRSLGYRIVTPKGFDIPSISSLTKVEGKYRQRLYELGVGEGIENHPSGNCFPLECNGDYLSGVSFFKGCYIGQELTSRVHHTGVVRKRIMPFTLNSSSPPQAIENVIMNAEVQNELGRNVGKVRGFSGDIGIGLMRITEALAAKRLFINLDSDKIEIIIKKPEWWPAEVAK